MINPVDVLSAYRQGGGISSLGTSSPISTGGAEGTSSFGDLLKNYLGDTVDKLKEADTSATAAAAGKGNLTDVVTAISKAELMLQTVVTIRDKVIAAYQDISKTTV